jgi:enoyl-CoA hydratase
MSAEGIRDENRLEGSMAKSYDTCRVEIEGAVARITIVPPRSLKGGSSDLHWDLGEIFSDLRGHTGVRVIVLTGSQGEFYIPPPKEFFDDPKLREYVTDPARAWKTFTGVLRTHQTMAEIEKPIVAKVGGDAVGFGSSLVFACDLIVATEDATLVDIHLGMGEYEAGGPGFGIVTGDGGSSLVPLFMSPAKAKEYLMLAKPYRAGELAEQGVINAAVPLGELDTTVDEMVSRLLRRSSYALAWTKRTINRRIVDALNMTLDASAAYEMVNFLQLERLGGKDPMGFE